MRAVTCIAVVAGLLLSAETLQTEGATPDATVRFLNRRDPAPVSYRAFRKLAAANSKRRISGWLEVVTELDPVAGFRFHVMQEGGSAYIRNKVLKKILEAEAEAHRTGERQQAALTADNYFFGEPSTDAGGLLLIPIVPKRPAEMLVNGVMVLNAEGDLLRVEGRLVKNPSFWTRGVNVVRRYQRPNGVRVAVETSSTAQVFIFGVSTFTMCIDYEAINGLPVDERTSCS